MCYIHKIIAIFATDMLVTVCIIAGLILALIPNVLWVLGWIGCTAPFRLGVNPEVTVITLKSL